MLHTQQWEEEVTYAWQPESLKEHGTRETRSFTDHYPKQQNGVFQCIEISNACETRKEERFLTI